MIEQFMKLTTEPYRLAVSIGPVDERYYEEKLKPDMKKLLEQVQMRLAVNAALGRINSASNNNL